MGLSADKHWQNCLAHTALRCWDKEESTVSRLARASPNDASDATCRAVCVIFIAGFILTLECLRGFS